LIGTLLMIVGALIGIPSFFGLMMVMFEPIHSTFQIVFKRVDDYVFYETPHGKKLLQRSKQHLTKSFVFFFVVGVVCFGAGWFLKYGPHGNDSLFSQQVESGTYVGDDSIQNIQENANKAKGTYVDANGKEYSYFIIISGQNISYNNQRIGGIEEFATFVKTLDRTKSIYIVDDFAVAATYHKVLELLTESGLNYETESRE